MPETTVAPICPSCAGAGQTPADLVPGTTCLRCMGTGKLPPYMASPDAWEVEFRRQSASLPENTLFLQDWLIEDTRRRWRKDYAMTTDLGRAP